MAKEKKDIIKSVRLTKSQDDAIRKSDYSVSEMIDMFLAFSRDENFELLIKKNQLETELRMYKERKAELEGNLNFINEKIIFLEVELKDILDDMNRAEYSLESYGAEKKINNAIQTTLEYYEKSFKANTKHNRPIDDFIAIKQTYLKNQATRCGLDLDEFTEKLLVAYTERTEQQILI